MADINSRQFRWLGADDLASTHLELRQGGTFMTSSISAGLLRKWAEEGKLEFIEDPVSVELPHDVVLQVQNGTINLSSLVGAVRAGIKER
jgi:hypothetical protein